MRIDKFLWAVRYFKTRGLASNAIKNNKVLLNGSVVKASKEVMPTDLINVRKNQINYSFEVLQTPKSRIGAKLVSMYIKDTTPQEEYSRVESVNLQQKYYREKGLGRPTKKDRRELDDFLDENQD